MLHRCAWSRTGLFHGGLRDLVTPPAAKLQKRQGNLFCTMNPVGEKNEQIMALLSENPGGLSISEIAHRLHANRNSLAKYLDLLLLTGRVEVQHLGAARVFFPAQRMPLTAILEFPRCFVIVLDRDGRIMQVNDRYLRFFRLSRANVEGAFLETSSLPLLNDMSHAPLFGGRIQEWGRIVREQRITRDETEYWFRTTSVPTVLEEGTAGIIIIMEDVTVERRQGIALALSEARYHAITDGHTGLVCRFLPDQTLTYVNEAWCRFFGTTEDQVVGRPAAVFLAPAFREPFARLIQSCTRENPQARETLPFVSAAGDTRQIDWVLQAIYSPDNTCREFQAVGRDATDTRETVCALQDYEASLDSVIGMAGELAAATDTGEVVAMTARHILMLQPDALVVMVFLPDREVRTVVLRALEGVIPAVIIQQLLGDRDGRVWFYTSPKIEKALVEMTCILFSRDHLDTIREVFPSGGMRPGHVFYDKYDHVLHELGIGDVYALGFVYRGSISGYAGICLQKDQPLASPAILKMYLHIAAIHLAYAGTRTPSP